MLLKALLTEDLKMGLSLKKQAAGLLASSSTLLAGFWACEGKELSSLLSLMIPLPNEKS